MQRTQFQRNRPIIRGSQSGQPLVTSPQPQIMPAAVGGQQYYPYPQPGTLQPLLSPQGNQILFPDQHFIDTSFESALGHQSPQLPPVFEYDGLKYIDTARVEPKIAYSPEKTPPKTPETPHFGVKPFRNPLDGVLVNPEMIAAAASPQPQQHFEMMDMSPPIATSEPKRSSMTLENLESSPGNTLRDRNRRQHNSSLSPPVSPTAREESPQPVVEMLSESPGNKKRQRAAEKEQRASVSYPNDNQPAFT